MLEIVASRRVRLDSAPAAGGDAEPTRRERVTRLRPHASSRYLRPYRLGACLVRSSQVLLISAFELLKPWPLKVVVDNVLGGKPLGPLAGRPGGRAPELLLAACVGLRRDATLVLGALAVLQQLHHDRRSGSGW